MAHFSADDPQVLALLSRLPMPIAVVRPDGAIAFMNPRATESSGYTLEEVPTLTEWRRRAFPDAAYREAITHEWDQRVARALATGAEAEPLEIAPVTKWGEQKFAAVFGLPMDDGFLALFFDSTQQHRSDADRIASEQRFRDIVEAAGEYVWECDADDRYTYLSDKIEEISGYTPQEMLGRRPSDFMPEGEVERVRSRVLAIRRDDGSFRGLEHRSLTRDGKVFWQLVSSVAVRDSEGALVAVRGTGLDITERKRSEEQRQLLESQVREVQKMQAVGTLAGGIAHEFNNLLAVILGHAALARRDPALRNATRENLDAIDEAAQQARRLVQQILLFGRRQAPDMRVVPMAPIVREALTMLAPSLPPGIAVEFSADAELPEIVGDPGQLNQLVLNLCINAAHAMKGCNGSIAVTLACARLGDDAPQRHPDLRPGPHVVLTVADQGCGMDAATKERIFEPFFTTKQVGEGTGLGLSVVDGIVRSHGGAIVVRSAAGAGSQFDVLIPSTTQAPRAAKPLAIASGTPGLGQRVLYVDDQVWMLPMVQRTLQDVGYAVTVHQDPRQALADLRANPQFFDLVITDYRMPLMSGFDVAREVRALRSDLPVAVISGYVVEQLHADPASRNVAAFIYKPRLVEELLPAVERLLLRPRSAQVDGQPARQ